VLCHCSYLCAVQWPRLKSRTVCGHILLTASRVPVPSILAPVCNLLVSCRLSSLVIETVFHLFTFLLAFLIYLIFLLVPCFPYCILSFKLQCLTCFYSIYVSSNLFFFIFICFPSFVYLPLTFSFFYVLPSFCSSPSGFL
jgi:hypothetical protein